MMNRVCVRVRLSVSVCVRYRHPAVSMLSSAANGTSVFISLIEALDAKIDIMTDVCGDYLQKKQKHFHIILLGTNQSFPAGLLPGRICILVCAHPSAFPCAYLSGYLVSVPYYNVHLLVENRSVVTWNHLVYEVARVEHGNPDKPLDYELRLEEVLTFFMKTLKRKVVGEGKKKKEKKHKQAV